VGQAGLSDARFPGQHHQAAAAQQGIVQGNSQGRHFLLAADEIRGS